MKTGIELITEERQRQVEGEGWSAEHDDGLHAEGQLAGAAACYTLWNCDYLASPLMWRWAMSMWPWNHDWWKPKDPIRDLTRAGALIAAEIDRLQRAKAREDGPIIVVPGN